MRLFEGTPFDRPLRCERCEELETDCRCEPEASPEPVWIAPEKQTARVVVEKRKRGKVVTVIRGLSADGNDLPALFTRLKTACGAGGALKDGLLEIQGDQVSRICETLKTIGYRVSQK